MKKIQILIITLVIVLLLGCATFATLYFATDIFKSNKDMFYKYAFQISPTKIIDLNTMNKYQERLENESNTDNGSLSLKMYSGDEEYINETFDFSAQSNPRADFASAKIDMKQNDEKKLTVDYLRNKDLYGLRFEDVIKQYIVFENNNLKEFAQKLGANSIIIDNIPNKLEMQDKEVMSEEEQKTIEQIFTKYINIAIEQIPNESYSKLKNESITLDDKEVKANGYELLIDSNKLREILIEVLKTVKDDEQVYSLIKKVSETEINFEEYQTTVESAIKQISESSETFNIYLKVYKQGTKTVKLSVFVEPNESNKIEISLEKLENSYNFLLEMQNTKEGTEVTININRNISEQGKKDIIGSIIMIQNNTELGNITFEYSREGEYDSNNIKTNFKFDSTMAGMDMNISFLYNNTKIFGENVETEEFEEGDYAIINQYNADQISNLTKNLITMIYEKIDEESTFFGSIGNIMTNNSLYAKAREAAEENTREEAQLMQELNNKAGSQAMEMFNYKFTPYEGVQSGANVKTLISAIEQNNISNSTNKVEYNTTITEVDSSNKYNVSFEKDSEGYINKAIIEEQ